METGYKITNHDMKTRNGFQWRLDRWRRTDSGAVLCTPGCLHYYSSPDLAAFMHVIHIDMAYPRLFRAEVEGKFLSTGTKSGVVQGRMRLVEELPLPIPTLDQRVFFAILCARAVLPTRALAVWETWATAWISGEDRSAAKATEAARAAKAETEAEVEAVRVAATAAARAAEAAAARAEAAEAVRVAAKAARAARAAARAAAGVASRAAVRVAAKAFWEAAKAAKAAAKAARATAYQAAEAAGWAANAPSSPDIATLAAEAMSWPGSDK